MPYFTMRDGEKIYALVVGKGAPCILLHGYGGEGSLWLPAIATLLQRYRFVLPDLRGYGRSCMAALDRNKGAMTQYVEDIDDLMAALEIEEAKLGGASLGAYACLQKQRINQFQRITHCLIVDHPSKPMSTPDWPNGLHPEVTDAYHQLVECFEREGLDDPQVPYRKLPAVFKEKFKNACIVTAVHAFPRRHQKWTTENICRAMFFLGLIPSRNSWYGTTKSVADYIRQDYDLRTELRKISIPVTIMMGAKSELFPNAGVMYLDELIPKTQLVRFEQSGHALFISEPIKFRRTLRQFIES